VRDVVRILHDVVEALAYAHSRGVVHRDIKPGNILTIGSHALVTDFGVAKALSAAMPVSGMTSAGMAIGTPAYMAPEQLAADPAADHRIDIYAVGLLAYELLSGQSPFVGTSPQATMAAQLTRIPDPLEKVRDDVPSALAAVIMRCLEKLPEHRPQTATALLDELDGVATPPSGGTGASSGATVKLSAAQGSWRQRRALIAGALLVVIAGAAVALPTWRRARQHPVQSVTIAPAPSQPAAPGTPGAVSPAVPGTAGGPAAAVAPARPFGDSATHTPIVLTRAESLAIAEAIRKRVTARRDSQAATGERALADSLTRRFEKALNDSLTRIFGELRGGRRVEVKGFDPKEIEKFRELARMSASMPNVNGAFTAPGGAGSGAKPLQIPNPGVYRVEPPPRTLPPPAPGVRRVLVGTARNAFMRGDLLVAASAIADSIRRAIAARPGYDVVDAASLSDPRIYASRTRSGLARAVGAGAVLTGLYFPRADSVVVLQLQLFDVPRNRVLRVLESKPLDLKDPTRNLGDLVSTTIAALEDIDWRAASDSLGARKPELMSRP
jgi:serine/threonine-protein kinase